ncbi:MAG: NADH-quinone oxidoreductase subunit N [Melioribacteraceae bacterium]|nr:NADH-quinone oxidoreductase subunit N [Melioribacteraceae bacterium]MCF8355939.1 NADH-quinone oxidoreductase subunit N [Melioribacteraceae bacterium]MCF8395816.1 NADH-quinone oxidoreductase subunit N [Melioribacteraceae bacterium]MCF8420808.1 NADH-quinone oxidoreductase subunit N [Melioribacteraceae bacterium]
MDASLLTENLSYILPEIVISAALIIIVLFDLIFHNDKRIIPYLAVAGLAVAGFFIIDQFSFEGSAFATSSSANNFGMITVDNFGSFFKLFVVCVSILIVFFSFSSEEIQKTFDRLGEYYALIFGMILGMIILVSASDLILIYLALELLSLSSYVLAGFTKLRDRNSEASLKYLIFGGVSSGLMLFGISIIYGMTGTTNLYLINPLLQAPNLNLITVSFAMILIFTGIGYKISSAPFHFWTPDVYEGAPIVITAFLSVASKAAGFALLIRLIKTTFVTFTSPDGYWQLINAFDWQALLIIISIFTMTLGNFTALWQNNLKRMLAYSSIAHAGYLLLGLVVMSDQGLTAILIYFVFYALMNLGAFYIIMLIANKTGSEEIDDYTGLGSAAPFLGVSLAIFLVSLTGLPPTAGFIGKLYIFIALVDAKMIAVAIIALLNTVVSLYYYVRVLKHMYLQKSDSPKDAILPSTGQILFILILLVPTLLFGVYFTPIVTFAKNSISLLGF